MGQNSKIEWCHHTFNPWRGCTKVSTGCANCYAEKNSARNPGLFGIWGDKGTRIIAADSTWAQPLVWNRKAAKAGDRHRVFCASLADVFEDRPELVEPRARLFGLIRDTPHLDWLLLTKRPENFARLLREVLDSPGMKAGRLGPYYEWVSDWLHGKPPANVWMGTSVENQAEADKRIWRLLAIPAATRFLSMEPLLGPVDLSMWLPSPDGFVATENDGPVHIYDGAETLSCIIVGGESGTEARPMNPAWVRSIRDQCQEADTPFFFKQWGEWGPSPDAGLPENLPTCGPSHHHYFDEPPWKVWKFGKKSSGRLLDNRTWDELPFDASLKGKS